MHHIMPPSIHNAKSVIRLYIIKHHRLHWMWIAREHALVLVLQISFTQCYDPCRANLMERKTIVKSLDFISIVGTAILERSENFPLIRESNMRCSLPLRWPCSHCQRKIDSVVNLNEMRPARVESRNRTTKFHANYTNCGNFTLSRSIRPAIYNWNHGITAHNKLHNSRGCETAAMWTAMAAQMRINFGSNLFSPFCFVFFFR